MGQPESVASYSRKRQYVHLAGYRVGYGKFSEATGYIDPKSDAPREGG
jgi:hypothetical protein